MTDSYTPPPSLDLHQVLLVSINIHDILEIGVVAEGRSPLHAWAKGRTVVCLKSCPEGLIVEENPTDIAMRVGRKILGYYGD